jgi:septum formation topological specificity factor MinE
MSKKVLNTQSVINELKGQSAFFRQDVAAQLENDMPKAKMVKKSLKEPKQHPQTNIEKETPKPPPNQEHSPTNLPVEKKNDTVNNNASNHASAPASVLANIQDDIVETIRKTVKQVGKDTLFVRLTPDEKHQVTSVVYALNEMYRGESRKTSENEIGRIGVNFLLEDYKANGEQSILAKVLAALNA